jgi:hypothetical protein
MLRYICLVNSRACHQLGGLTLVANNAQSIK